MYQPMYGQGYPLQYYPPGYPLQYYPPLATTAYYPATAMQPAPVRPTIMVPVSTDVYFLINTTNNNCFVFLQRII